MNIDCKRGGIPVVEERAWRLSAVSILRHVSVCNIGINDLSACDRVADLVLLLLLWICVDKDSRPVMHDGTVPVVNSTDYKKRKARGMCATVLFCY